MEESKSREKILKKVRAALIQKVPEPPANIDFESDLYQIPPGSPEEIFAREFSALNGKFVFCESENELKESLPILIRERGWQEIFAFDPDLINILSDAGIAFSSDASQLAKAETGICTCEFLIARTGTVMVSAKLPGGRRLPFYPHICIVVAYTHQIVMNVKDGLKKIREKYKGELPSMITAISGPSRTADIEKTLVQGAHGPRDIYVFLTDRS